MNKVVLLVEDHRSIRSWLEAELREEGFLVLSAADPIEALKILRETRLAVDVLVCDVLPPFMTGLDLAVRVAQRDPNAKALFMSEFRDDLLFPAGGGIEFIRKPFGGRVFRQKVRTLARRPKSQVELRI